MRRLYFTFAFLCILSYCRTEINFEEKDSLLNGFIEFLNNLPNHQYSYEDGILLSAQEAEENYYKIETKLKEKDSQKYSLCTCTLKLHENGVLIQDDVFNCEVYPVEVEVTSEGSPVGIPHDSDLGDKETEDEPVEHKPVELDNEIRPNTEATSGEQFVAIPREEPIRRESVGCIGCGSHVDPAAPGVADLAAAGVRQLDRHEPNVKHSLNKVVDVERQVQVVNGVRYIVTMLIDFNNCTSSDTMCTFTKPCKVSVLEKPWIKLPNGAKYRAIISNNCTETWLFGDNGEVVSEETNNNDKTDDSMKPTPDYDKIANTGSADDILKAIYNKDLQSQQTQKFLSEQEIRNLEAQIIPYSQFQASPEPLISVTESSDHDIINKNNPEVESVKKYSENSNTENQDKLAGETLSEENKKIIDELNNFFNFAGYTIKDERQTSRNKRSYTNDIKVMSLLNKYKKVKESLKNAKYMYYVGHTMVDYLNEVYYSKGNLILQEVITAEEESDDNHHFIYLQVRAIPKKLEVTQGSKNDQTKQICNGIVDGTIKDDPEVLHAFCYDDSGKKSNLNTAVPIPVDDKVLQHLMNIALKKLESQSSNANAIKVSKIISASTQRGSGVLTKVSAVLVYLNCSKKISVKERNNCVVLEDLGSKICEIEIFQRDWLKTTNVMHNCIETQIDQSFSKEKKYMTSHNINDKNIVEITQEALSYLETQSNRIHRQKIVGIKSASTQLIGGLLTSVDFLVGYTNCKNGDDVDIENCNLLLNETLRYCTVKDWQRPWLEDSRDMKVICNDNFKGNDTLDSGPTQETTKYHLFDDNNDMDMAKESLEKYLQESGIRQTYEVVSVDKVKVQADEKTMYLDFTIKSLDSKTINDFVNCHSFIHLGPVFADKNITVDCEFEDNKSGGQIEKDPNSPEYRVLAEESMRQYLLTFGVKEEHKIISVDKVSLQVVSGTLTRIDFTIKPISKLDKADSLKCHSKVWEQRWLNKKEITVNCKIKDNNLRAKRQVLGGDSEKDPNDPKYKVLAEESMQKYLTSSGTTQAHRVISVDKVTYKVVAGTITTLHFTIQPVGKGDVIKCHSEVFEQSWLNKKEIKVDCETKKSRVKRQIEGGISEREPNNPKSQVLAVKDQKSKTKQSLRGGINERDASDPKYKALADESMKKFLTSAGMTQAHKVISVDKVTYQVVSGSKTTIDFTIKPDNEGDEIKCNSVIWEQPWLHNKEINVSCEIEDQKSRTKRSLPGGINDGDPNDPKYKALAEESMQKYLTSAGMTQAHKVISVDKVTYQVVSGSKTTIDFTIKPNNEGDEIKCNSAIWEQPWLHNKEINVSCEVEDQKSRTKRSLPGGINEGDPNDPKYKALAEESMQKYLTSAGMTQTHKVISVDKVTYQVVSGSKTTIDFTIKPNNEGDEIKCYSVIWEQPWLNNKQINVSCEVKDQKSKTDRSLPGGINERDPNDPKYKALAEESMKKYLTSAGMTQAHKVISVDKVTFQVVAGSKTSLDFTIKPVSEGDVIKCHSEVWEKPWLNMKDIRVNCEIKNQELRTKRHLFEGASEEDADDPKYKRLAEESLNKYMKTSGVTKTFRVLTVDKVTVQVMSGLVTRLNFTITSEVDKGTDNLIKCYAESRAITWLPKKEINVTCNLDQQRAKEDTFNINKHKGGVIEQNPDNPHFLALAKESLQKYKQLHGSKSEHVVLEVKKVTMQVVAGTVYRINFNAKRTFCEETDMKRSLCNKENNNKYLFCFSKIWSRPWLKQKKIDVSCYNEDLSDVDGNTINNHTQEIHTFNRVYKKKQDANKQEYKEMAKLALKKYKKISKSKYAFKVDKIHHVTEQVSVGITTNIDFVASPDNCLSQKCPEPKVSLHCQAEIWERPGKDSTKDIMSILCKRKKGKASSNKSNIITRGKRDIDVDENDIEEELKYHYADLAVKSINDHSRSNNLFKLISVHAIQTSTQMRNTLVRMYLEVAQTFCLRHGRDELNNCDELNGVSHKLCHARLYPSTDDEIIVRHVSVTCNDDEDFEEITGLSIPSLLTASIKYVENDLEIPNKMVIIGPPYVIPSLDSRVPIKIMFVLGTTNCSKDLDFSQYHGEVCMVNPHLSSKSCNSFIFITPHSNDIRRIDVQCYKPELRRTKRWISMDGNVTSDDIEIRKLAELALQQLELQSLHRYKQKILEINNYSTKITSRQETRIDFEVGYTSCIKYEWVDDLTSCKILEHLPRRQCNAVIYETLWDRNGKDIRVECKDDDTPLEAHVEFIDAKTATLLANEALRHIEAKFPHPRKQKVVRIFSLEKQAVAGLHYRMKIEVGLTNCSALSDTQNCEIVTDEGLNKFCRVNVWIRPWVKRVSLFRVTCDYQNENYKSMYQDIQAQHLFSEFLQTYKPDYIDNDEEMVKRYNIFRENVKKIHELNVGELGTGRYGVTRFADLTYEEFSGKYMGLNVSKKDENNIPWSQAKIPKLHSIPAAFDWRDHGAVTEVKDQGSCGSCWAFSVTGNIEGQWKVQEGELVSLSEQELVDCDKLDDGCNGGLPDNAYRAIEQLGGLELENDYPYEGEDDKCSFNKTMARVQIRGAVNITSNETDMAKWLVKNGPISIGINANAMQFYMGGVSHPWKMLCNPKNLDHGVLIVGYGVKDYPLFNKHLPYWTIKNSWGKSWGEQGYYRVYRGDGTCGVNQMASSAIV